MQCFFVARVLVRQRLAFGGGVKAVTQSEIYAILTVLFRDIFDDDSIEVTAETTAMDVEGWDSLSNIRLILAVETAFSIRLTAAQVAGLANVGGLVNVIATKVAGGGQADASRQPRAQGAGR
jgi:acyl carrier protein